MSTLLYHTVIILTMCVGLCNKYMINRQYLLSSITEIPLYVGKPPYPPNCTTNTVVGDIFHTEREWPRFLNSGMVSYKMEYSVLYDITITSYKHDNSVYQLCCIKYIKYAIENNLIDQKSL